MLDSMSGGTGGDAQHHRTTLCAELQTCRSASWLRTQTTGGAATTCLLKQTGRDVINEQPTPWPASLHHIENQSCCAAARAHALSGVCGQLHHAVVSSTVQGATPAAAKRSISAPGCLQQQHASESTPDSWIVTPGITSCAQAGGRLPEVAGHARRRGAPHGAPARGAAAERGAAAGIVPEPPALPHPPLPLLLRGAPPPTTQPTPAATVTCFSCEFILAPKGWFLVLCGHFYGRSRRFHMFAVFRR